MGINNLIREYNINSISSYYVYGDKYLVNTKESKKKYIDVMFLILYDLGFKELNEDEEDKIDEENCEFVEGGNTYNFNVVILRNVNYELYKNVRKGNYLIVCNVHLGDNIRIDYSNAFYKFVNSKDEFYDFINDICSFYCRVEIIFKDKSKLIVEFDRNGDIMFNDIDKNVRDVSFADKFFNILNGDVLFDLFYY